MLCDMAKMCNVCDRKNKRNYGNKKTVWSRSITMISLFDFVQKTIVNTYRITQKIPCAIVRTTVYQLSILRC